MRPIATTVLSVVLTGLSVVLMGLMLAATGMAADLQSRLVAEDVQQLAEDARQQGDPLRGAILFYQPYMACASCHESESTIPAIGPDLARIGGGTGESTPRESSSVTSDIDVVQAVLSPSLRIAEEYRTTSLQLADGRVLTGMLVEQSDTELVLRELPPSVEIHQLDRRQIEEQTVSQVSAMPMGLVNQLASRQQFLDLVSYLIAIRDGGPRRQLELRPPASAYATRPLPSYEHDLDHAGMIGDWDDASLQRGRQIYESLCVNCHGTRDKEGSMPTSLRFAAGQFKNGSDPYSIYQTLTKGFGLMAPQTWMVPQQKYDVIHYLREAYLREHNPGQLVSVDDTYLASLPAGQSRGPQASTIEPWKRMDYGPNLVGTYEIGSRGTNFAYKGNAIRLDAGPGGVSRGQHWMVFDYDTLRVAAVWNGEAFIDWNGIHFNGRHGVHPRIGAAPVLENATGPGWADPQSGAFVDDRRVEGRDGRRYGPLPRDWARYRGMRYHGQRTLIEYTVGNVEVIELPGLFEQPNAVAYTRTLNVGPASHELVLQVAQMSGGEKLDMTRITATGSSLERIVFGPPNADASATPDDDPQAERPRPVTLDGQRYLQLDAPSEWAMQPNDFTIVAQLKTTEGGTIFARTQADSDWVPGGQTWFIRDGYLAFDIGWVGVVQSPRRVNDGKWHTVAMTSRSGIIQFWVDGEPAGGGELRTRELPADSVVRIGYTAPNFPEPQSAFQGEMRDVWYIGRDLPEGQLRAWGKSGTPPKIDPGTSWAHWPLSRQVGEQVKDEGPARRHAHVRTVDAADSAPVARYLVAGVEWGPDTTTAEQQVAWETTSDGNLRLRLPPSGQPRRLTLWTSIADEFEVAQKLAATLRLANPGQDLTEFRSGGPRRWPEKLTMPVIRGEDHGPFAVDQLVLPLDNPWFCRMRLTGLDFADDGDTLLACDWDGNVWRVEGLGQLAADRRPDQPVTVTWQRVASGLFQPLGIRIVNGQVYVTCRDQICKLHDLNEDGEYDYYECFNNDHQVTEHFHEFAMGLQVDRDGNFYYAKSARHALPAIVPHHGTLLRVTPDGTKTEIVAFGFRAANGVCLNDDGSFFVTDQEGHWNPKNRINWVTPGGFYGNMMGYHDVQDASDDAMQQPLCWITNAFDRSPAELLWCTSSQWGPLDGSLLSLSYGNGKIFVVPHEQRGGQMQGGMCELPIAPFPTGIMRGRFHPSDGQLYVCGMTAWASDQPEPGGLYRIRATGKPMGLPTGWEVAEKKLALTFTEPLEPSSTANTERFSVQSWSLKRSANYGSQHYDMKRWEVAHTELSDDRRTVTLVLPDLAPTWCVEIKYDLVLVSGERARGTLHGTIHHTHP